MNVLDTGYLYFRNTYTIPISQFPISVRKAQFWDFKNLLATNIKSFRQTSNSSFQIRLELDDFYKCMNAEAELFFCKSMLQYNDYVNTKSHMSHHWSVVTTYYLNFYSVTTLLRLLQRGFTFLSSSHAKSISDSATILNGETFNVGSGNYFYEALTINEIDNTVLINFTNHSDVHKSSWDYIHYSLLPAMIAKSRGDEEQILKALQRMGNDRILFVPSVVRNDINYHSKYGVESISGKLNSYKINEDLEDLAYKIIVYDDSTDVNVRVKNSTLYGNYFFLLMLAFYKDYNSRLSKNSEFLTISKQYFSRTSTNLPFF